MAKEPKEPKDTKETTVQDGKSEALKLAIAQITKQFGDGSIMKLGENHNVNILATDYLAKELGTIEIREEN